MCNLSRTAHDIVNGRFFRRDLKKKMNTSRWWTPGKGFSPVTFGRIMVTSATRTKNGTGEMEDAAIVSEVLSGNAEAFRYIMERYEAYVMAIVRRHVPPADVEDNMQEVFLRSYRSLPTYKGDEGLKPWLSMIAVRTCYDFWRTHSRKHEVQVSALTDSHDEWIDSALAGASRAVFREEVRNREAREVLEWAMGHLSAGDRMVLELVYFEDRPVKEAGKLLGLSTVNVKVRLFRARKRLRALLSMPVS
jgi:RNA polymerase sigma-70 factor, ECF subfamily